MQKLSAFLARHNQFMPAEEQDDCGRSSRARLEGTCRDPERDRPARKQGTNGGTALACSREQLLAMMSLWRLHEHLEWLSDTINRMNEALRLAPMFTNNERYQFCAHERPAHAALLKFIKDVALYGPTEDLLGGAVELPKEFEELMQEKTIAGSAAVKSALDDYREFFDFDIEVLRAQSLTVATKHIGWLSKRVGSGSGGEHRAPHT